MLTKRIIPCLDVKAGRVVKGKSFIELRDAGDPVDLASFYYKEGADELVFLDITATPDGRDTMADVVERNVVDVRGCIQVCEVDRVGIRLFDNAIADL